MSITPIFGIVDLRSFIASKHTSHNIMRSMLPVLFALLLLLSSPLLAQQTGEESATFPGELIVQTKAGADIHKVLAAYPQLFELTVERELSETMRAWHLRFDPSAVNQDELMAQLRRDPAFSIVQPNHRVWLRATPNDPQFGSQWHHVNNGQGGGTVDADTDADQVWDITTGGTTALGDEIVVCIIEGVNMTHPDLIGNRWQNTGEIADNGIDDDNNGYIDDLYGWNVAGNNGNVGTGGHGTNVAGMIGAKGNNSLGVAGVNWNVKIMVVSGHNANSEANVIAAYNYPLVQRKLYDQTNGQKGAFVVSTNASWGIDGGNPASVPLWCAFYDTLGTYGILSCGATTNSNLNVDVSGDIPTACASPYMIGVGRSDRNDNFAGGYGLNTIDLASPGINVWTTDGTNGYVSTTGTSFASPLTAGAIALLYSAPCVGFAQTVRSNPHLGADMVKYALLTGVDVKPSLQNFFITGGRLNVKNSMDIILEDFCNACQSPVQLDAESLSDGEAELTWSRVAPASTYTLYYREAGDVNWVTVNTTDTTFTLVGLDNCSIYEYYVQSTCEDNETSDPSLTRTFSALSYCATQAASGSAGFTITAPTGVAGNYGYQAPSAWGGNLQAGTVFGQLVLVNDGGANPTQGCAALLNGAAISGNIAVADRGTCEFGIKALNAQNAGATAVIIINNAAGLMDMGAGAQGANVTIPVIMISQADGNTLKAQINGGATVNAILGTRNEWIQALQIGAFALTSGNDNGYAYHTGQGSIQLLSGISYNVSVTASASGNAVLTQRVRIWLDSDHSGTFGGNELLFDATGNSGTAITGTLTIPANAQVGNSRLRVQTTGLSTTPNVCGDFTLGEAEDYCVTVSQLAVGILDASDTDIRLYPNPAMDILNLQGLTQGAVITVFDASGRQVHESVAATSTLTMAVNSWAQGVYTIRMADHDHAVHARFAKI